MSAEVSLRRGTNGDLLYPVLSFEIDAERRVDLKLSVADYNLMTSSGKSPLGFLANIELDLNELEGYKHEYLQQIERIKCLESDAKALENVVESLKEQLELLQQQGD